VEGVAVVLFKTRNNTLNAENIVPFILMIYLKFMKRIKPKMTTITIIITTTTIII
jgi:hypothetical protein